MSADRESRHCNKPVLEWLLSCVAFLVVKQRLASFVYSEPLMEAGMEKGAKSREHAAEHVLLAVSFLVEDRKEKESSNQCVRRGARPTDVILPPEDCVRPRLRNRQQLPIERFSFSWAS